MWTVHPHACGDNASGLAWPPNWWRFTPTRVGTTPLAQFAPIHTAGSPPRVWGQRAAGNGCWLPQPVHPHACGDNDRHHFLPPSTTVHPHACGDNAYADPEVEKPHRFTPTRVGTTGERFVERDGMFFTHSQAARYDTLRARATAVGQMSLFVTDERSAIQWLRRQLQGRPQTYADIQPKFLQELQGLKRHEKLPELRDLLEDNFLQDDQGRWCVPDPDKQEDLERLREKELLREFALYLKSKGRLRVFRSEAVRAGFRKAWREGRYADILAVANRLPRRAIEEDPQLLMYVDNARLRLDTQPKQGELW